jgi:hypothetical protein
MKRYKTDMRATNFGSTSSKVVEYGSDRVCKWPGCTTVLRATNPDSYCGIHQPKIERRRIDRLSGWSYSSTARERG